MTKRTKRLLALMAAKPKLRRVSGLPPLTYKAKKAGTLTDYRIYGQTSRNLFNGEFLQGYWAFADGTFTNSNTWICTPKIQCLPNTAYTFSSSFLSRRIGVNFYDANKDFITCRIDEHNLTTVSFTTTASTAFIIVDIAGYPNAESIISINDIKDAMLNEGSTPLTYEPYGESVGDRTGNLFDCVNHIKNAIHDYYLADDGTESAFSGWNITDYIPCKGTEFTLNPIGGNLVSICFYDENKNFIYGKAYGTGAADNKRAISAVLNVTAYYIRFTYSTYSGAMFDDLTKIMLNSGSTPLPYEPYGYKVPVTVEGKNLLQNTATSQTIAGVTCTVNSDGSVTCNGTATRTFVYLLSVLPSFSDGSILTGCPKNGSESTYSLSYTNMVNTAYRDYGEGCNIFNFDYESYPSSGVIIRIASGYTCDNLTFYPMIRKADIEDDTYEPYQTPIDTDIYLPEQIRKVGDEAEYIDYGEQKQHRVRKNLWSSGVEQGAVRIDGQYITDSKRIRSKNIPLEPGTYTLTSNLLIRIIYAYNGETAVNAVLNYMGAANPTFTVPEGANNVSIGMMKIVDGAEVEITPADFEYGQIEKGETATSYEPYITNTELDVTLPALPTVAGTNTLTVGTEVQPSLVEVTGRIRPVPTGGGD